MKSLSNILYLFLILSFAFCSDDPYVEIFSFEKTKFNVDKENNKTYFKYELTEAKGPIGLNFLIANLYTVNVTIYKTPEEENPIENYILAEEPFKEIDTSDFDDYVYIVIEETSFYYYEDYITIYDPNMNIVLTPGEPLTINKFLTNSTYTISFSSEKRMDFFYNTLNDDSGTRIITIKNESATIIKEGTDSYYQEDLYPGNYEITVENYAQDNEDEDVPHQDFSLVFYEKECDYLFNKLTKGEILTTKYIQSNNNHSLYYYVDITGDINSNSINFKLYFKYYIYHGNATFYTSIIELDDEITDDYLAKHIPDRNDLPFSYDDDSDEFFRIYYHDENQNKKYKYLLVKVDIIEDYYYVGSHNLEVSIGNQTLDIDLKNENYYNATEIRQKVKDYIPTYLKLLLDQHETYLLTTQNEELTVLINGDLLTNNNTDINHNYLNDTNEIIVLSDISELTIKLFGSTENDTIFYVEKINISQIQYVENDRNNDVFEINMTEEECENGVRYVLGTYDYEKYAYGEITVNYYATVDSGEFVVYYKDFIKPEESEEGNNSLFPQNGEYVKNIDEIIVLNKDIDLYTIKCIKPGSMSIRPEYKTFEETTHIIEPNGIEEVTLYDYTEIVQLTTPLGLKDKIIYFSIVSLDGDKLNITADTPGVFNDSSIENEPFFTWANSSEYKMDQLAIRVQSASLEKNLEVTEVIHDENTTYLMLKKGKNEKINNYNVYFKMNEKYEDILKVNLTLESLKDKTISYGVIKTAIDDGNYLNIANNYSNTTIRTIKEDKETIEVENVFIDNRDKIKPYVFLVLSVLDHDSLVEYNVTVDIKEEKVDNTLALLVVIIIFAAIILGSLVLALFVCFIKKRNAENDLDNPHVEKLYPQNLNNQVDP